ncbi:MAG: response regulator transcription factor [Oscillospiraceae bacterium]|nr:response regulator transcription factor [Oscillospiraceae bacterium]
MMDNIPPLRPVVWIYTGSESGLGAKLSAYLSSEKIKTCEGKIFPDHHEDISMAVICDSGVTAPAFELIESIRACSDIPIMTVSRSCGEIYSTMALHKGADICLSADSLGRNEFTARTAAMLRRYLNSAPRPIPVPDTIVNGSLAVDRRSREFFAGGRSIRLTSTQFGIVEYLMENCGRVCSIEDIYRSVWKETPYGVHRTVVDHIRRIRGKIEPDPHNPRYIKAVFGVGYKMERAIS